jgi:hypothetical protein
MKWAADKKLQLDVAVIKAAHLLDQASLDEVIETLTALQSGATAPSQTTRRSENEPPRALAGSNPAPAQPSETGVIDAAVAWDRVAASYESSIKFRWLTKGVFAEVSEDAILVRIPPSSAIALRSVVGEDGRKDAEAKLNTALGRKVKLRLEVGEELTEPAPDEPAAEPAASFENPAETAPARPRDPAEEFKNDPLIKKALEIFAGEIQTATK